MHPESDEALVRRFRQGDKRAFEAFVLRYQDRVFRLACVYLYASEDAADAAQEVFLRAYKGLTGFRFGAQPFTWLFRVVKNVCHEYNRKRARDRKQVEMWDVSDPWPANPSPQEIEERAGRVREMVESLPKRQRDVVVLRIFEGLSINETASALRCRPGTVKAHLHKAIVRLRELYGVEVDSEQARDL